MVFILKKHVTDKMISKWMQKKSKQAEQLAKTAVPVKSGKLKTSIYEIYNEAELMIKLGSDAPYATFVELGTHSQSPHPFLRYAARKLIR